ncbi:MYND-type domain-containing protein [Mycena kentingensis (nom. inval.)]|nr:MYND-type domain-containing protein [Mycena kentingensis (nom. inval.)]
MDPRFGAESLVGIGGRHIVSKASLKASEKGAALARAGRPNEAAPYLLKAVQEDMNNLDAHIETAFISQNDPEFGIEVIEGAMKIGRKLMLDTLGPNAFDDDGPFVGHFYDIAPTRPYMRVLQAAVRLYIELASNYAKSAETIIEMLRLCPGDNMGQRTWLGATLLHVGRNEDALRFSQVWISTAIHREAGDIPMRGGALFDGRPPVRGMPATPPGKERLWKYVPAVHLYNAALASFRLWGADSEEAIGYLEYAANINPHVVVKYLGGVAKPPSLSNVPRTPNGNEDAHDYRWLTHELWTTPEVLAWVRKCVGSIPAVLKKCGNAACNKREAVVLEFKQCAGCHQLSYCGKECQKAHWPEHKADCTLHSQIKQAKKSLAKGKTNKSGIEAYAVDFAGGVPVVYNAATRKATPMPMGMSGI